MEPSALRGRTIVRNNALVHQVACPNGDGWIDLGRAQYLGKKPLQHERCGYSERVNFKTGMVIQG